MGLDKLCSPHLDDSLRPCPSIKVCGHSGAGGELDLVQPGTFTEWIQNQHWQQVCTCFNLVDTILPYLMTHWEGTSYNSNTATALSVDEPNRQSSDGDRWRWTSGYLRTFADLPLDLILIKVNLGRQLCFSHAHPEPGVSATNCGSLCSFI